MSELLDYNEILRLIPERAPALMVDRLQIADDGKSACGLKNVSMGEEYFLGHFPGAPIMPGVLQTAAMGQIAGLLLRRNLGTDCAGVPVITEMSKVKFRKPVVPGDRLLVHVEMTEMSAAGISIRGKTTVDGEVTSQGNLVSSLLETTAERPSMACLSPELPELDGFEPINSCDIQRIMGTIPHRFPFLLIDRALMLNVAESRVVAYKNITGNEPLFRGLPGHYFPGCYQVEAAAQAACIAALSLPENQDKIGYFMSIDKAIFHAPVIPGDQLIISLSMRTRGQFGAVEGELYVGSKRVADLALKFALVERGAEKTE